MTEFLETSREYLLQEQVETVVLLEPQGRDEVLEVPVEHALLVDGADNTLYEREQETILLTEGRQGPTGPPGMPGPAGGQVLQRTAGQDLSALMVVYEGENGAVWPADPQVADDVLALVGVTVSAAAGGTPVNVQRMGFIEDSGWQWQPGKRVFLGHQGRLTQEPPQSGYDVLIGAALSATRLLLNIQDPIALE